MNILKEPLRFLSTSEMESIHHNALRILAEVGMRIAHDEALDFLATAGYKVDRQSHIVRFPQEPAQRCVDRMRGDFARRKHPEKMAVRYSHVRFRREDFRIHPDFSVNSGGYNVFIYDLEGKRRPATLQDTRQSLKLVAQLDQITYSGIPCSAQDVPLPIRPITMAAELVKHTDKLGGIEALNKFDIEYICKIGEVVRGSREEFKRNPVLVGYAETKSPLTLDNNMCEIFLEYLKLGLPQSLDTMPNCGATAPMHPAGALALGMAETLGGLMLAYAVDENACVTVDLTPSFSDMRTGIFKYAGAERIPLLGARIQMISEYYRCPSGVHGGKTDSCVPDMRAGLEKGISMLMPVLCGAVGFGTVGQIENAVTYSPLQLVADNEIAGYVRRAIKGFEITDQTVDFDLIKRVGIGGNYLQETETAESFRDFLNLSPFFAVEPWGNTMGIDDARRMETLAHEKARRLLANDVPSPLDDDQIKEVDKIVASAKQALQRKGKI